MAGIGPCAEQLALARLHLFGLVVVDVVVAHQVQKAVDEQEAHLRLEGVPERGALTLCDVGRDDDVSELEGHVIRSVGDRVEPVVEPVAFEGENVGRPRLAAELLVELSHARVIDERERHLGSSRRLLALEDEQGELLQGKPGEAFLAVGDVDQDLHGSLTPFPQRDRRRTRWRRRASASRRRRR